MVIVCSLPVALSLAETFRMPLASMSNVTSICGTPRGRRRDALQVEPAEGAVVARHLALALQHVDLDRGLAVGGGGEHLRSSCVGMVVLRSMSSVITPPSVSTPSDSGVTSSSRMSFTSPASTPRLDRRADRDHLVRVDALVRLLAEEVLHQLLDLGHAGRAADEHHLVDVLGLEARVLRGTARTGSSERSMRSSTICSSLARVSFSARCFGPVGVGGEERQVDLGLHRGGELDLRLLRRLLQALQHHLVLATGRCPGPS